MKKCRMLVRLMAAACVASPAVAAGADIVTFNFNLDGSQEVPANNSNAVGSAQLIYNTDTQRFSFDMVIFGIDLDDLRPVGPNSTPAHIHLAPPGVNGPIVVDVGWFADFFESGQGIRLQISDQLFGGQQGNIFTEPDDNEKALFAGDLYVNVHTLRFPGGEIRGQIVPAPGALALLSAAGLVFRRRRRQS